MRPRLSRISCTIPADLVVAADRTAAREQRSRSWVIAESLRRLLAEAESGATSRPADSAVPAEAAEAARSRRLEQSLATSPEARLAEAEALGEMGGGARPRRPGPPVIGFTALLDYSAWQAGIRRHA